jgi:membrane-associated phospholipid phosphatase
MCPESCLPGDRRIAALVVAVLIWRFRWREAPLFVAISSGGGDLSALGLKYVVHRVRPPGALVHLSTFSFPSGRVVGTLALCVGVTWVLSRHGASHDVRLAAWTGSFLLTVAVGVSRIELAVHYTSDVIGGFALAGFWLAAAVTLWAARDLWKLRGGGARVTIGTRTR